MLQYLGIFLIIIGGVMQFIAIKTSKNIRQTENLFNGLPNEIGQGTKTRMIAANDKDNFFRSGLVLLFKVLSLILIIAGLYLLAGSYVPSDYKLP